MDQRVLNIYLSRILSGFYLFIYNNCSYKLIYPDIKIKYEAELYAAQEYENNKFNDWIHEDTIIDSLVSMGIWTYNGDDNLKNLEKQIEDLKVDLYKNFLNPTKIKSLRRTINNVKNAYNTQYNTRHSLDQYTVNGYSQTLKNQYILIHSLYDINNKRIFDSVENTDYNLLNNLSNYISEQSIDIPTYRMIARNEIWKNYWSVNSNNFFDKSAIHWTDEQKLLVMFTKMYDSAKEHPECPSENVFEDDDMFDGWMIFQRRENEKIKNKNRAEKLLEGKNLKNANEVFVIAESQEEAQNIYNLNDTGSRHIIKERHSIIQNSKEQIEESKLPDVQRKIMLQRVSKK